MTLRTLPAVNGLDAARPFNWKTTDDALDRWTGPLAAEADNPATISIYDVIGEDPWTGGGVSAKRIAAALRSVGKADVTVNINSPGGDLFEGLAIYNLLREHPAKVTVQVMGLAASAASVIAMAADDLAMGLGSFLMIHKSWGMVLGNEDDFREAADVFGTLDRSMVDIYAARTGQDPKEIARMMRAETWLTAADAVEKRFADRTFNLPETVAEARAEALDFRAARRTVEGALKAANFSRSQADQLLKALSGKPGAASNAKPGAGVNAEDIFDFVNFLKGVTK